MSDTRNSRIWRLLTLALLVTVTTIAAGLPTASGDNKRVLTVMTRNLYLGTSLDPILGAVDAAALFLAVDEGFEEVQATDFVTRAQAIADEIDAAKPHLVGLQEVTLWRTDFPPDGPLTPAETVAFDFLEILLDALADRGLSYQAVATIENFDGELPARPLGSPFPTKDVRLTDRDVLLARTDLPASQLQLSNPQAGNFVNNLTAPTPAGPIEIVRGWTAIDVKIRGKSLRVVNAHLETSIAPPIQVAQAQELLAGPGATSLPVVFIGDFNSAADGTGTPTYEILTGAGFVDAWWATRPGRPGYTCCRDSDLADGSTLDERIDLVLSRGGIRALATDIVGEDPADKVDGLWPSDHAGVTATLQLDKPGRGQQD